MQSRDTQDEIIKLKALLEHTLPPSEPLPLAASPFCSTDQNQAEPVAC